MPRPPQRRGPPRVKRLLAVSLLAFLGGATQAGDAPLPYTLAVRVDAESGGVGARLVDDVREAVRDELRRVGCVRELEPDPPSGPSEADLVLQVVVVSAGEEARYEASLGEISDPNRPPSVTRPAAVFDIEAVVEVIASPTREVIRSKRLRARSEEGAARLGDPRETARRDAIDSVARKARAVLCRGSGRAIRKALDRAPSPPSSER